MQGQGLAKNRSHGHVIRCASVSKNFWGGDTELLGQIDLPITLETSHYLLNIIIELG